MYAGLSRGLPPGYILQIPRRRSTNDLLYSVRGQEAIGLHSSFLSCNPVALNT